MAPEILRYEKYDAKADLWSVGAVLFEMSVGKPPFRAQNHVDLLRKIERGEDRIKFPDDKKVEEGTERVMVKVGMDIKTLIRRLLKRNPTERMSFEEFFREANWVAEGGSAERLVPAEAVSAQYARLVTTAPSPTPPPPPIPVAIPSSSKSIPVSSQAASSVPRAPLLHPPPPTIPAYIDVERPAFARRLSSDPPEIAPAPKRSPSFSSKYVVAGGGVSREGTPPVDGVKARDFAVSKVVRRAR